MHFLILKQLIQFCPNNATNLHHFSTPCCPTT